MTDMSPSAPSKTTAAGDPLRMLRFLPDLAALARWVAASRQEVLREDMGYALHAVLRATLGQLAPKPFALLQRPESVQLIGYTRVLEADLRRALELAPTVDPLAARALGLMACEPALIKPMPRDWRAGEQFSFEVRVAPVVRSREQARPDGGYPEIDAAWHPRFHGGHPGDREAAHARWLEAELQRGGAARLIGHRMLAFNLMPIARRTQQVTSATGKRDRGKRDGLLPDLHVRGRLAIENGAAFDDLLARGLGRHRSFGYGCLLLAPAGAWT